LLGIALKKSPAFIELRRIEAAKEIATLLAHSKNRVYLDSETLLLNLTNKLDENLEKSLVSSADRAASELRELKK
jgi:prohibitin 2